MVREFTPPAAHFCVQLARDLRNGVVEDGFITRGAYNPPAVDIGFHGDLAKLCINGLLDIWKLSNVLDDVGGQQVCPNDPALSEGQHTSNELPSNFKIVLEETKEA